MGAPMPNYFWATQSSPCATPILSHNAPGSHPRAPKCGNATGSDAHAPHSTLAITAAPRWLGAITLKPRPLCFSFSRPVLKCALELYGDFLPVETRFVLK